MSGVADMIVASVKITPERFLAIDFLTPILSSKGGIFIKNDMLKEDIDFAAYKNPFDGKTWMAFILSLLLVTFCIMISWKNLDQSKISLTYFIKALFASLKANLGNDSFLSLATELKSFKVIAFFALLFGNVLWLAYNGALLSGLLTPKVTKPFNDFESFSRYSYRFDKRKLYNISI